MKSYLFPPLIASLLTIERHVQRLSPQQQSVVMAIMFILTLGGWVGSEGRGRCYDYYYYHYYYYYYLCCWHWMVW